MPVRSEIPVPHPFPVTVTMNEKRDFLVSEDNFQAYFPVCMYNICVLPHRYSHRYAIQRVRDEKREYLEQDY